MCSFDNHSTSSSAGQREFDALAPRVVNGLKRQQRGGALGVAGDGDDMGHMEGEVDGARVDDAAGVSSSGAAAGAGVAAVEDRHGGQIHPRRDVAVVWG